MSDREDYELYNHYIAVKNHFSTEHFDYFKYQDKKYSPDTYLSRSDRHNFTIINKQQRNPKEYIFANLLDNPNVWIGDIAKDRRKSEEVFVDWERRMQSLSYNFKEEIGRLDHDFDANFICRDGKHPPLLRLLLQKKVSIETMCLLDKIVSFVYYWDKCLKGDPIWKQYSLRIRKYSPFLTVEVPKFKQILRDKFSG